MLVLSRETIGATRRGQCCTCLRLVARITVKRSDRRFKASWRWRGSSAPFAALGPSP